MSSAAKRRSLKGLRTWFADVSDESAVRETVNEILAREGRIDILVNNAGFGISGAAEFTENADAKKLMDVNLFGAVNMTKAVHRADARARLRQDCEYQLRRRAAANSVSGMVFRVESGDQRV